MDSLLERRMVTSTTGRTGKLFATTLLVACCLFFVIGDAVYGSDDHALIAPPIHGIDERRLQQGPLHPSCGTLQTDFRPKITPNACRPGPGISIKKCTILTRRCRCQLGIQMKWTGRKCGPGNTGDGGCQCASFCKYRCASKCRADAACQWTSGQCLPRVPGGVVPGQSCQVSTLPTTSTPTISSPTSSPITGSPISKTPSTTPTQRPSWSPTKSPSTSRPSLAPSSVPTTSPTIEQYTHARTIAMGSYHVCELLLSGRVQCWGANNGGQLGSARGDGLAAFVPVNIYNNQSIMFMFAGAFHTCTVLEPDGMLACWGSAQNGRISGSGIITGITSGCGGDEFSCVTVTNGTIFCFGGNSNGEIGDGTILGRDDPVVSASNVAEGFAKVACGDNSACAVTFSGAVYCWGANDEGQLGNGTISAYLATPVHVATLPGPAMDIALSRKHACATIRTTPELARSYPLWCWGKNAEGQLGIGTSGGASTGTPVLASVFGNVRAVTVALEATCFVVGSDLQCGGKNWYGLLGTGNNDINFVVLSSDQLSNVLIPTSTDVLVDFICRLEFCCAKFQVSPTMCWGAAQYFNMGNGTALSATQAFPVIVDAATMERL